MVACKGPSRVNPDDFDRGRMWRRHQRDDRLGNLITVQLFAVAEDHKEWLDSDCDLAGARYLGGVCDGVAPAVFFKPLHERVFVGCHVSD